MTMRRLAVLAAVASGPLLAASPALAHGIGARGDLPLPLWLVSYAAGGILVVSFAALAWLWPRSRWEEGVTEGRAPRWLDGAVGGLLLPARVVGLVALAVVWGAAAFGPLDPASNLAPTIVYVVFWVGFLIASGLVGDLWRAFSPFETLAALRERIGPSPRPYRLGHWPAAVLLLAYTWLELVHPSGADPRLLAWAIAVYLGVVVVGTAVWGRAFVREGEAFGALFGVIAHMAPFRRDADGRLRVCPPLAGLAELRSGTGTAALVLVALGTTSFDGLSRMPAWEQLVAGRPRVEQTLFGTGGLVWTVAVVALLYWAAVALIPRLANLRERFTPEEMAQTFVHSLVPIALAYAVAHYFSLLIFQGQAAFALGSDPFGQGWDLFGTAGWEIDYTAISTTAIAFVQAGAIVVGHVAGVILAHDRSVGLFDVKTATRTQYPMLGVMVLYTVGGLVLLLGG